MPDPPKPAKMADEIKDLAKKIEVKPKPLK